MKIKKKVKSFQVVAARSLYEIYFPVVTYVFNIFVLGEQDLK